MPANERAICRRLREFRLKTGFSQAQFAAFVGLRYVAYAGFEYARTQLNYHAARKILSIFWQLNPIWLADGIGEMLESRDFEFPSTEECGAGQRSLFSGVFRGALRSRFLKARVSKIRDPGLPVRWFPFNATPQGILYNKERFGELLSAWLADLPDSKVAEFLDELFLRGAQIYAHYPRNRDKRAVEQRKAEMYKLEFKHRFGDLAENAPLDKLSESVNLTDVKPLMPGFRERLKKALAERGRKTALAKLLGVPLASVSQWLSGEREPGGEYTLKLLRWVEQQERKT